MTDVVAPPDQRATRPGPVSGPGDDASPPPGLTSREAARRLVQHGANTLTATAAGGWWSDLVRQLLHPLALLLEVAAVLAAVGGLPELCTAIAAVVVLNALFALVRERQATRAVEALRSYLPLQAVVVRDGVRRAVPAENLVPGDLLVLEEGAAVSADARLVTGAVEVDMSALTGESVPVERAAAASARGSHGPPRLDTPDHVFSGSACLAGEAAAVVTATGMSTELGRIAALSQRGRHVQSPLEQQVNRVAWLIAAVAVAAGVAFLPLGWAVAGLPLTEALLFAIGLLVANVPEGLLPTISLALAGAVRRLARQGALVKRLSAVETLGSTTVICTDKTGTLTQNRMTLREIWVDGRRVEVPAVPGDPAAWRVLAAAARCTTAHGEQGDPMEAALLDAAASDPRWSGAEARDRARVALFRFDPARRRMATVDRSLDGGVAVAVKGAPEAVLPLCTDLTPGATTRVRDALETLAADGLRVLAVAGRIDTQIPASRDEAERDLTFLGLLALEDPPRPSAADAVERCHAAGVRIHVVTGDNGRTAEAIGRQVGIGSPVAHAETRAKLAVVDDSDLGSLTDAQLRRLLDSGSEVIFARSTPQTKLHVVEALQADGEVVAVTGDGVNDAPALHRADIGVAMGRSGTDVAREAATMVLTDDDFADIVTAVEEGRRVFANIRKFVTYIFAHATPEVVPFLLFALSGGAVPLPLTVMQILAIDLGTETLPALALAREPAEPDVMRRPPRRRSDGIIDRSLLVRAWGLLGGVSTVLVLLAFLVPLRQAGWRPGDDDGAGTALHHAYLQATTLTFLAIVACQIGTVLAARVERASLRTIGLTSNPLVLAGIAFELVFVALIVTVPVFQTVFGTAVPPVPWLAALLVCPVVVLGADELVRWFRRSRSALRPGAAG